MLGSTEQVGADRAVEVQTKLELLRELLERRGLRSVALTDVASVAWITGGVTNRIEPGNPDSPLWIVVGPDTAVAVTTNVERARLETEAELPFELVEAPWFEPNGLASAASELAGSLDALDEDDLVTLRLTLLQPERERLEAVAVAAASALEGALRSWRPGELDYEIQARVAERLERAGAFGACLIVGGDDRVERFRHPLAAGEPVHRLAMAVVVAERHGLHAAATRFASVGPMPDGVRRAMTAARSVERAVLDSCVSGTTYGEVLAALDRGYAAAGHPGAWREHYQGGPIGYKQREFELAPGQAGSRWLGVTLEPGQAQAWNPSVAGGGKAEDTYLLEPDGLRLLSATGDWPLEDGRPAVLDLESGGAA